MVRALVLVLAAATAGCASLRDMVTPDEAAPSIDASMEVNAPSVGASDQVTAPEASAPAQEAGAAEVIVPVEATRPDAPTARIAADTVLTLPLPPGYPETRTIVQTGRAQHGDRQASFESVLSLGPERTEIVLMMPIGPRLATIVWDETGIHEDRSVFAPDSVPVENILADIFLSVWPAEAVAESLPEGVSLIVDEAGVRTIRRGEALLVTVTPDPVDTARTVVRNESLGYEVAIIRQSDEP
jgi:hypothetical protein